MAENITVQVELCGPLQSIANSSELSVAVPADSTVSDVRAELKSILCSRPNFNERLFSLSAMGNNERILQNHEKISEGSELFLLPPVSGG